MIIMLEEGALPEQVDKVMVDFGYPIGPFATADLSGLDIGYDSRQRRATQNPNYRKLPIADAIVEAGRLGQKTGAGWFRYEKYREEFSAHDVVIAIDETPVGTFVEIEGGEAAIHQTAAALGRTPDDYITDSYRFLFLQLLNQTDATAWWW